MHVLLRLLLILVLFLLLIFINIINSCNIVISDSLENCILQHPASPDKVLGGVNEWVCGCR